MEDGQGVLRVCGEIVPDSDKWLYNWLEEPSLCPNDVHAALRNCAGAPLTLKINSPGGEITAGAEIYTALWEYPGALTFDIVGLAASEAGVISAASAKEGNRCRISPLGLMMIHNVRSEARGDYRAMEAERERLLAANATLVTAYVRRTGKTEDEVRTLMDSEKWYSPREALDAGLVTTDELMGFLGADDEARPDVERVRASAIERLQRATGIDWEVREDSKTANEAVQTMVYLTYYAVRDAAKNTDFLRQHLTGLIKELQYPSLLPSGPLQEVTWRGNE